MAVSTRVVVVSSVRLFREALSTLLADGASLDVAGTAPSVLEAIPLINGTGVGAVVLTTPADGGCFAADLIHSKFPDVRLVVLGVSDDDAAGWVEAGAVAVLPNETSLGTLEQALDEAAGAVLHSTRVTAALLERFRLQKQNELERVRLKLTTREWDVARLVGDGLTNKEIAARLSIELPTVKSHVHSVLKKLGARGRVEVSLRLRGQSDSPGSRRGDP